MLNNLDKYLDYIKPYTFLCRNRLIWKDNKHPSANTCGKTDKFIKNLVSFVKENVIWQFKSSEQLRNFCYFLNDQTLNFGNKKTFLVKFLPVLTKHHHKMPIGQLTRGIKFLRMVIECLNTNCFAPAL